MYIYFIRYGPQKKKKILKLKLKMAWPFLVGGVICLVNSDNERDLNLLNSYTNLTS